MEHVLNLRRMKGVDVGYHSSSLEPLNGLGRVGKAGIDKTFTLENMIVLAHEIRANIIVKAGPRSKWYLKRIDIGELDNEIRKQNWRDTSRATMWVIEWDN